MARSTRRVLKQLITGIPDLLARTITPSFSRDPEPYMHISTLDEVADRIASLLPALLAAEGYALIELPHLEPDGYGSWSVRVPLSEQPWADGEVLFDRHGRFALIGIPSKLPAADAPAVAAALLAVHTAIENHRHRNRTVSQLQ
ncbi:hypothetical protein [Mycobacteroides abscessus]|uniref:hypothetical protein n=1 Tax=Mycobacteroides abscessus TaxID=36809 RepID=UPI002105B7F8|nr:hypothetical protein [Mycobacteroides abscessus]